MVSRCSKLNKSTFFHSTSPSLILPPPQPNYLGHQSPYWIDLTHNKCLMFTGVPHQQKHKYLSRTLKNIFGNYILVKPLNGMSFTFRNVPNNSLLIKNFYLHCSQGIYDKQSVQLLYECAILEAYTSNLFWKGMHKTHTIVIIKQLAQK